MKPAITNFINALRMDRQIEPLDGDCDIIGLVLEAVTGGELYGLYNHTSRPGALPAHFVVRADEQFIDGVGTYTREQLEGIWRKRFRELGQRREANRPGYVAPEPHLYVDRIDDRFESREGLGEKMQIQQRSARRVLRKADKLLDNFTVDAFLEQAGLPVAPSLVQSDSNQQHREVTNDH